jgi:uncharacterized protein YgbK (DUF1537 family)
MSQSFENGKVLVVADDLTGANDAAVQFAKTGLKTVTLLEPWGFEDPSSMVQSARVLAVSTESRNIDPQVAQEAVRSVFSRVFRLFPAKTVFKKIDSTLRGNIEVELMALSDALEADASTPVIFSPAYPSNGRTVNGGYVLVDGVPLCLTFAAQDALAPARSSQVAAIFAKWRDRVGNIHFSVLEKGEESVRREIRRLMASGKSVIVSDALTDEDLLLLVRSVRSLGLSPIWAGSAGLAWALAQTVSGFTSASSKDLPASCEPARPSSGGPQPSCGSQPSGGPQSVGGPQPLRRRTLVLFGSLNPVSAAQVEYAKRASACRVIEAPHNLDPAATCEDIELMTSGGQVAGDLAVVSFNVPGQGSPDEMAKRVKAYFASVAERVMRGKSFKSLVLSGGDVGRAVLSRLGITCMTVEKEVLPGIAFGRACDGEFAGTGIVTKAGGFGDADALLRILSWMSTNGKVVES